MNKVILGGRLTHDPELKMTPGGLAVTSFGVAVNRRNAPKDENGQRQNVTDFLTVVAWRERAELVCRYFRKGSSIALSGSIQTRSFTTKEGEKRYATEILADEIYFVDSKAESGQGTAPAAMPQAYTPPAQAVPAQTVPTQAVPSFEVIEGDEELPF